MMNKNAFSDPFQGVLQKIGLDEENANAIFQNRKFSVEILGQLQKMVGDSFKDKESNGNICVIVVGSFGRLEASNSSDLDYLVIHDGDESGHNKFKSFDDEISKILEKMDIQKPSKAGKTFESPAHISQLTTNIGGNKDKTQHLTWRVLMLTESRCLYNETLYHQILSKIFDHYTKTSKEKKGYPRALMNELIRYYRTVAVDYLYKAEEINKPWALRNLKLRHSRKLWFFSTIALMLHRFEKPESVVYESFLEEIRLPPVEKVATILLEKDRKDILTSFVLYNKFLEKINNSAIREQLNEIDYDARYDDNIFSELKENSDEFHKELIKIFNVFKQDWDEMIYNLLIL
jgi:predicted nucleotidyltransferase